MAKRPHFRIYRDVARLWRFTLIAGNGEAIAYGESYTRKVDVKRAIRGVVEAVTDAASEPTPRTVEVAGRGTGSHSKTPKGRRRGSRA